MAQTTEFAFSLCGNKQRQEGVNPAMFSLDTTPLVSYTDVPSLISDSLYFACVDLVPSNKT